jgi:hypothetical protein
MAVPDVPTLSAESTTVILARNEALTASLRGLVAYVNKNGGYMSPEQQSALRQAEALLVEGEGAVDAATRQWLEKRGMR